MSKVFDVAKKLKVSNECVICKETHSLTIDHIYPKTFGGANHVMNYRIMCIQHNKAKGKYIDYTFNYIDVISVNEVLHYIHTKKFPFISRSIKNFLLKKCFNQSIQLNQLFLVKDWEFIVDYLKLFGINLNFTPTVKKVVDTPNDYIVRFNPSYDMPKHIVTAQVDSILNKINYDKTLATL